MSIKSSNWVGLTDEEMQACWNDTMSTPDYSREGIYKAIESKLREKNAGQPAADAYTKALEIRVAQGWKLTGKAVPVLYTDAINGEQVLRDDVWLCTTDALRQESDAKAGDEPVAWIELLEEAEKIVQSKPTYKRFIDGTPLANDIAVWMADFAENYTRPQPPAAAVPEGWKLVPMEPTDEMLRAMTDPFIAISGDNRAAFASAYRAMLSAAPKPEAGK